MNKDKEAFELSDEETAKVAGGISGSVATVSTEELMKNPSANITQALQNRIAGVTMSMIDATDGKK